MTTYERWNKKRVLITVRTYPSPSRKSIEVSCTAGITDDSKWIRLYPIPYRFLNQDKRFKKYQYIEANVTKAESDTRLESYKIDIESINILPESIAPADWLSKRAKVFPLMSDSMCALQLQRDSNGYPTLGFIKPKAISSFKIEPCSDKWTESELTSLRQYPMFGTMPSTELQKLPYDFSYRFICSNPNCRGHEMKCTDWEVGASYWSWKHKYGNNWERKFRDRYETEMILKKDTHFFVGTIRNHPDAWIIIGLFYPPR